MSNAGAGWQRGPPWLWLAIILAPVIVVAVVLARPGGDGNVERVIAPTAEPQSTTPPTPAATPTVTPATPTATPTTPTVTPATPTPAPPPPPVTVTPAGEEVPRLAFAQIVFREPPPTTDASQLVAVEPPIAGSFVWADERTLLFQPEFPGWGRGGRYRVLVDGAAAGLD